MENLIRQVEGELMFSIADSTMMLLVQHAMDKAHEKIKMYHGPFARLNHISKFYELAVMQLDGCLKFVQQETGSCILDSNHKQVLLDLRDIRDRLNQRLLETELAILEKDKVLMERSENEQRLKQVLENKETELFHLQANLERTRSDGLEEFLKYNSLEEGTNEAREGEISELKCSVDQQVMSIRQKLEPNQKLRVGEELKPRAENKKIEKMGVDIDVLKGTMDLAFSKMHNAISLSELAPIEQTWRRTIEEGTMAILIKGYIDNARKDFEEENKKFTRDASVRLRDHILDSTHQILLVRREIECLAIQNHDGINVIMERLGNLSNLNSRLREYFSDDGGRMLEKADPEKRVSESNTDDKKKMDNRSILEKARTLEEEKEDTELIATILEDTYLTLYRGLARSLYEDLHAYKIFSLIEEDLHTNIIDEILNEVTEREKIESVLIETTNCFANSSHAASATCLNFIENNLKENVKFSAFKEITCDWNECEESCSEEDSFRQEIDWIIIQEILRNVLENFKYHTCELPENFEIEKAETVEKERNRAYSLLVLCQAVSQTLDDYEFKIAEKLKKTSFTLANLEMKLHTVTRFEASLKERELIYRKAFVLKSENLRKAETEVDLLGDQVDALVRLLQRLLWALHQHPLLLRRHPDILEISKQIENELSGVVFLQD